MHQEPQSRLTENRGSGKFFTSRPKAVHLGGPPLGQQVAKTQRIPHLSTGNHWWHFKSVMPIGIPLGHNDLFETV